MTTMQVPQVSPEILASQIAYANLDESLASLRSQGEKPTIAALLKEAHNLGSDMSHLGKYLDNKGNLLPPNDYANNWSMLAVKNENNPGGSGFYGCILDTGDTRILALRGSEDMGKLDNLEQDWIKADLGLLNAPISPQDAALARFTLDNKSLLSEKPWLSTGHSLGGELADFASIMAVKMGLEELFLGSTNLDGPGMSYEKINAFRDEVSIVGRKNKHYIASFVGEMLNYFPGAEQIFIDVANESQFLTSPEQATGCNSMNRHDTRNWVLDENGYPIPVDGQVDGLALMSRVLSRGLDKLPAPMGDFLVFTISTLWYGSMWVIDEYKKNPEAVTAVIVSSLTLIFCIPIVREIAVVIAATIVAAIVAVIGMVLLAIALEAICEFIEYIVEQVVNAITAAVGWLKDKSIELIQAVKKLVSSIRESLRNTFNAGARYVNSNPYFKVDTDKLRSYAIRINNVNNRLRNLDRELRSLYWQVGFLDLWDIMMANLITSGSPTLMQIKSYLNNAAERFEKAENKARGNMGG